MIVVAILGVLAAIATINSIGFLNKSRNMGVVSELKNISQEIDLFYISNGRLPDDLDEIGLGNFRDPWDNPYRYLNIANVKGKGKVRKDHNLVPVNTDFDLYSMGPDGKSVSPFTAKQSRESTGRAELCSFKTAGKVIRAGTF